jgi:hypothetical protein
MSPGTMQATSAAAPKPSTRPFWRGSRTKKQGWSVLASRPRKKPVKKARKRVTEPAHKPPAQHSETCLQMHCRQWLSKSGLWDRLLIFHVANERKGSFGTHMHFKRMGVRPGVADWLLFLSGRSAAIELKDDEGTQNADQKKFQRQWEAAGNLYFLVRTLEEFQGVVNALALFA